MKIVLFICLFFVAYVANADSIKISGSIVSTNDVGVDLKISVDGKIYDIAGGIGTYKRTLDIPEDGFYNIFGNVGNFHFRRHLYIQSNNDIDVNIELYNDKLYFKFDDGDNVNIMIDDFYSFLYGIDRKLWDNKMDLGNISALISEIDLKCNALIKSNKPGKRMSDFMKSWAYVESCKSLESAYYIGRRKNIEVPKNIYTEFLEKAKILDNEDALTFYSTPQIIRASLGSIKDLDIKLDMLHKKFLNPRIVNTVRDMVIRDFVNGYDYTKDFQGGLDILKMVCSTMGDKGKEFINLYKSRKYTVKNAELPDVLLEKIDGSKVSLKSLTSIGKIIYIDCWASWCAPCCQEIPYLLKLKKELLDKDIIFVSISSDSSRELWIDKMKDLGITDMKYQFLDRDFNFGKIMNIKGIPHFLIYGKDGKLKEYKTARPSNVNELKHIFNKYLN